jgi:energy-converting hydrogenase Eha subunit A
MDHDAISPDVDESVDVLTGWDPAGPPRMLDGSAPFPTDTVIVVGATIIGMALGVALGGRHPLVRAKLGGLAGLVGAVVARRMWQLPGTPSP